MGTGNMTDRKKRRDRLLSAALTLLLLASLAYLGREAAYVAGTNVEAQEERERRRGGIPRHAFPLEQKHFAN